ncbi:MAG: alpha/beta hydrolase [Acidimicrobiales bacterium]
MPLDPQIQPLVDLINAAAADAPPADQQTAEMRREGYHGLVAIAGPGPELHAVDDASAPGPNGDVGLRIYRPLPTPSAGILVYYHGGGWCIGDLDTHDEVCRSLAKQSGQTVVSVDYRLGPEHRFPAAVEDSWAALEWVAANTAELAVAGAPIAVAGDSAGGNLAAVMSLMARDNAGPAIAAQLLIYPGVDMLDTQRFPSHTENASGYVLTRETMDWFMAHYLEHPDDAGDWRASPLRAPSFERLPPALVITAEFDPLRDEGAAYAKALADAGNEVEHRLYEGMVHIFFQLGPVVGKGAEAVAQVAAAARAHLQPRA